MRPHQWVKNLFVLVPIVFSKGLTDFERVDHALIAFASFCLAASSIYLLNDLIDVEADRAHPKKRSRPIASGMVPTNVARGAFGVLAIGSVGLATAVGAGVAAVVASYLALNVAYTFGLKRVAYVDVLCIATGFELRVLAGMLAVDAAMSTYLLVVTFALASFLGFGKRMHEFIQGEGVEAQRSVLRHYRARPLKLLMILNGVVTIVAYVLATLDPTNVVYFGSNRLAFTTVFTAFGIIRFVRLVSYRPEAESPTEEMLRDKPFLLNIVAWFIAVVVTVYVHR